jgi:hypothetical protein
MEDLLPRRVLDRRYKIGFAVPETQMLFAAREWITTILESEYAASLPMFDRRALLARWQAMTSGDLLMDPGAWRWVNFVKWAQLYDVDFSA